MNPRRTEIANKLSVAYSQGKLPVGWAALLLLLQKEELGAWWNRREGLCAETKFVRLLEVPSKLGRCSRASHGRRCV